MFLCRTQPVIYLIIYSNFTPVKDYESKCFKITNIHYLKFISEKEKEKNKAKKHIRIYVWRLEKFLQQRFKQLNLSLYFNRRSNYINGCSIIDDKCIFGTCSGYQKL